MAHISPPSIGQPLDDAHHFRQPEPQEQRSVLAVLLTGRDQPHQPAIDHFLRFAEQQGLSLDGLWAAYDGQTPVYSSLIVPGAGKTAVLFTSPLTSAAQLPLATNLVKNVLANQSPEQTRLVQVLLEPMHRREQTMLERAGFSKLAALIYMRRSCLSAQLDDQAGLESYIECEGRTLKRIVWSEENRQHFASAIEMSYLDTLDCPNLVGVRHIEDIIAGHMAVGRFEADLWSAYYADDEPAAVLLLNPLIDRPELELVYLGLAPAFREKRLATRLMQQAIATARARHDTGIHLAVDQLNTPAVKLYKGLGFRATGRKTAMICALK